MTLCSLGLRPGGTPQECADDNHLRDQIAGEAVERVGNIGSDRMWSVKLGVGSRVATRRPDSRALARTSKIASSMRASASSGAIIAQARAKYGGHMRQVTIHAGQDRGIAPRSEAIYRHHEQPFRRHLGEASNEGSMSLA